MNISGIGKTVDVGAAEQVNTGKVSKDCGPSAAGPSASADISKPGELFAKLQQLQAQDPAKFKEVMTGIADSLRGAAQKSGNAGGGFLEKLADRFDHAADSGDMSALQPPQNSPSGSSVSGHHHPHHGHHGDGDGGGRGRGAVSSILEKALTQVNQALAAGAPATPATPTTPTTPTTSTTPATTPETIPATTPETTPAATTSTDTPSTSDPTTVGSTST